MAAVEEMAGRTVEDVADEVGRIVSERQELRASGADDRELEVNRLRLVAAQADLTRLLLERHLGDR
jgi:hypothetical protein